MRPPRQHPKLLLAAGLVLAAGVLLPLVRRGTAPAPRTRAEVLAAAAQAGYDGHVVRWPDHVVLYFKRQGDRRPWDEVVATPLAPERMQGLVAARELPAGAEPSFW